MLLALLPPLLFLLLLCAADVAASAFMDYVRYDAVGFLLLLLPLLLLPWMIICVI